MTSAICGLGTGEKQGGHAAGEDRRGTFPGVRELGEVESGRGGVRHGGTGVAVRTTSSVLGIRSYTGLIEREFCQVKEAE